MHGIFPNRCSFCLLSNRSFATNLYGGLIFWPIFFHIQLWGGVIACGLGSCKNTGKGFVLVHGIGTQINAASHIGDNCTVLHNVTIGGGHGGAPTLGNNVFVGAGALIIGGVKIGDNVNIGAGAIVVTDVPSNSTVVCEKARIITR